MGVSVKSVCGVFAAIMALCCTGEIKAQPVAAAVPDVRVPAETFAIFPWDHLSTPEMIKDAYDCGFNIAGFCSPEMLDEVQKAHMQCFVTDPLIQIRGGGEGFTADEITSRVKDITRRTAGHPAVFGYHLLDEPRRDLFPVLALWTKAFAEAAPGKVAYTNLLPEYGDTLGAGGPFQDYLTSFVEMAGPKAYSYDHYALFEGGGLRDMYFSNLEDARATSLKTGVPFWQIVLGNCHFNYAEPSPAGMRFQAYTTLAYGARGLGWFTFTSRDRGNYRSTAIDAYGHRTPTFGMIRDVNLQVQRLAPTLANMKSVAVYHTPKIPKGCKGLDSAKYLKAVKGPGQYLVGEFESETSGPAVLVVNTSLTTSTSFSPQTKEKYRFEKVSAVTGKVGPWSAENNWLAPGQGMLLLLKQP